MIEANWLLYPEAAYEDSQRTKAADSRRRPVTERSIIRHQMMFARVIQHLGARGQTVATFGPAEMDGFLAQLAVDVRPDKTTTPSLPKAY
jgi:integrase/recombinase XerD